MAARKPKRTPTDDPWVPIASVGRPHGVRGELRVHPFHKESTLLLDLDEVLVRFPEGERAGEEHEVSIDGARATSGAVLLTLHGVDDRDAAASVTGAELCVRRSQMPRTEAGEFYEVDVLGASVLEPSGAELGTVTELRSYPSVDVLVVAGGRGRWEIPLVDAYVEHVDVAAKRVTLRTLDGLEAD